MTEDEQTILLIKGAMETEHNTKMEPGVIYPIRDHCSVKVMRSYDYCHFEVVLHQSYIEYSDVDQLRKEAMRLVDRAVEQYKVARTNQEKIEEDDTLYERLKYDVERIRKKPEGEWTPKEKAAVKALNDEMYRNRRRYDYDDDWDEPETQEYHEEEEEYF